MSKLMAVAGLLGILALPSHAQNTEQKRSCWLRDIAAPSSTTVYAVCDQGSVYFTRDAGAKWQSSETNAKESLRSMVFLDENRGLIVGRAGTLLATEDGAKTWVQRKSGTTENLLDISFVGDNGWISGYAGKILHTTDGGKTWSDQTSGTKQTLETIYFRDAQHGWAAGWAGTIMRTSDGGKTWTITKAENATWSVSAIYFRDLQNGWLVGFSGQILRSKDGGVTWDLQPTTVGNLLTSVTFDSTGTGWITHDDGFLVSEDKGDTWKEVKTDARYFTSRVVEVGKSLWAMGQSTILRREGSEWKKIESLVVDKRISFTNEAPASQE